MLYLGVAETDHREMSDAVSGAVCAEFTDFAVQHGERLRRALVAGYGVEVGNDVCADAMAYAWAHWERVAEMDNPVGYLYRVAQTAARRHWRWRRRPAFPPETARPDESADPRLGEALARLATNQRQCVVLVHVYDWTYQQTADALELPVTSVRNHVHRGLKALRETLEQ